MALMAIIAGVSGSVSKENVGKMAKNGNEISVIMAWQAWRRKYARAANRWQHGWQRNGGSALMAWQAGIEIGALRVAWRGNKRRASP